MSVAERLAVLTPEQRALFEVLRQKQQKAARILKPPPIPRVTGPTGEGDWPLSLDQERYWFMEQLYPGGAGLNITAATRMRGPLSPPRVERAPCTRAGYRRGRGCSRAPPTASAARTAGPSRICRRARRACTRSSTSWC